MTNRQRKEFRERCHYVYYKKTGFLLVAGSSYNKIFYHQPATNTVQYLTLSDHSGEM